MNKIILIFKLIFRTLKWFFYKLFSKNIEFKKKIKGSWMIIKTNKKGLDIKEKSIFKQLALDNEREFEATKIIEQIIKPGFKVFELGANVGYYALLEAKIIGNSGHIFAIEPEKNNFDLLNRNIKLNNLSNVTTYNIAIADQSGKMPIYVTENSNLHSMIKPKDNKYYTSFVKTMTVDDFLSEKDDINFIRMDIEGYEYQALRGMNQTLNKYKNIFLFIELHTNLLKPEQSIEILEKLKSFNYEIETLISHDTYIRKSLGLTKVENITIEQFKKDPRLLKQICAFEIFFKKLK